MVIRGGASRRILVVDDEGQICEMVRAVLEDEGYAVHEAGDGQEGLKSFFTWSPSMVIMDVSMPKLDGWQLLGRIREVSDVPVMMLTARGHDHDKVRGLRQGADDYVVKPVTMDELVARVEAILRRAKTSASVQSEARIYRDSELEVDLAAHRVLLRGEAVDLSPQEFRLLAEFVSQPGVVLSAGQLLDRCWPDADAGPENVRVYMGYLRKKLETDPRRPRLLETVREFGYRYCPQR